MTGNSTTKQTELTHRTDQGTRVDGPLVGAVC
jgi:hypothetical protein